MQKPLDENTEAKLAQTAQASKDIKNPERSQSELIKELVEALRDSKKSADRYGDIMIVLTTVMFLVSFNQLIFTISSSSTGNWSKIFQLISFAVPVLVVLVLLMKLFESKHKE